MIETLPRREREVFEAVCGLGEATAAKVRAVLTDPPCDSAVRTILGRLVAKGLLTHRTVSQAFVYSRAETGARVAETALDRVVRTFFAGSAASAASALLGMAGPIPADELDALQAAINEARERGE